MSLRYPLRLMMDGVTDPPGWRSTSDVLANAPANASRVIVFDLGPEWWQWALLQITITATAALTSIAERASDNGTTDAQDLIATSGVPLVLALSAAGSAQGVAMVAGRYVRVPITNGATAQGPGAGVRLVLMPA